MKLVIFDLDGVLVRARDFHYEALNRALAIYGYTITREEHLAVYDGLPTTKKLELLTERKGLSPKWYEDIQRFKQAETLEVIRERVYPDKRLIDVVVRLRDAGYQIAVASNAVRETVRLMLLRAGLMEHVDFFYSNEDVRHPKPNPEMYLQCMIRAGIGPKETLIVEDAPAGRSGAIASGAVLCPVMDPDDVTWERLAPYLHLPKQAEKWLAPTMNVLIPMAGAGKRFAQAGYTFPKPLIEVNGKPMIQAVVDNLGIGAAHFIFVAQREHEERYNITTLLKLIAPGCDVVLIDGMTEGAACTTLLAKKFINTDAPLILANSDQLVDWNPHEFMYAMGADDVDGGMAVFPATHPKWSFARIGEDGYVAEVAEKRPISNHATVGIYYWRKGSEYVKYAEQMIAKDIRVNGEFYVCPVFNEAIADGKQIKAYAVKQMWGLGTPEDLREYLDHT